MNEKPFQTLLLALAFLLPEHAPAYDNPNKYLRDESGLTAVWNSDADDGTCWVCHPGDDMDYPMSPYSGKVVIPEEILGRKVVGIQRDAFKDNVNITEIVISGTVLEIQPDAFVGCTGLRTLSFLAGEEPIDVGKMGVQAAALLGSKLDSLFIDRQLKFDYPVSSGPFQNSALRVIAFGPNITQLTHRTFADIPALEKVVIPPNLKDCGTKCFYHSSIDHLIVESSEEILTASGQKTFYSCSIRSLDIDRPTATFGGSLDRLEEVRLGPNASPTSFEGGKCIVKADLACSTIPTRAYENCSALKELILREGVTTIETAFQDCTALEKVILPDSYTANSSSPGFIFGGCTTLRYVENLNVSYVPNLMFCGCKSLQEITFGEKVDTIGSRALAGCLGLKKVTISSSVSKIWSGLCPDCDSIQSFIIADSDVSLSTGGALLWDKDKSVEYIYFGRDCDYYSGDFSKVGYTPFANGRVGKRAEFGPLARKIPWRYLRYCGTLEEVTIGPGVELIESESLGYCISLEEIIIPPNVKEIQENAFLNCTGLKKVIFGTPDSPSSRSGEPCLIAVNAFNGASAIREITVIGQEMPQLGANAFHDDVYTGATLKVPTGMATIYRTDPQWSRFEKIEENISTGLDTPATLDDALCDVFSLQGNRLLHNAEGAALRSLSPGIYIIRTSEGARKTIIR